MNAAPAALIANKKSIPTDPNAYIFRRLDRGGKWFLYYYDKQAGSRHRVILKNEDGVIPKPVADTQEEAFVLGLMKYMELKSKTERGESIKTLTFGAMCKEFLDKEEKKISSIPHQGISAARFRLLSTQLRWIRDFIGDDKKQIHRLRRSTFLTYEVWRKERAIQSGKSIPVQTTIAQEISTLGRAFNEVGVARGFISRDAIPELPRVKLPKDKKHRRDDFTEKEWLELERCSRQYWIKGVSRKLNESGEPYKNSKGSYETTITVKPVGRGKNQLVHRQLVYWAMRISMDTGIRPGSLRKIQWKHISENTAIPKEERKTWVIIEVPPENTKTGRYYRISAPIAAHLEKLREATRHHKREDYLFTNQTSGAPLSSRIWHDSFLEVLVEARIADWAEDDSNNQRKADIHSGKNLTWYSFRHTHITMRLKAGTPVPVLAANTDTSMKYIEDHYFHYRADESTEILSKGRKGLRTAEEHLGWTG